MSLQPGDPGQGGSPPPPSPNTGEGETTPERRERKGKYVADESKPAFRPTKTVPVNSSMEPIVIDDSGSESSSTPPPLTAAQGLVVRDFSIKFPSIHETDLINILRSVDFDEQRGREDVKYSLIEHLYKLLPRDLPGKSKVAVKKALIETDGDILAAWDILEGVLKKGDEADIDSLMNVFSASGLSRDKIKALYRKQGRDLDSVGAILSARKYTPVLEVEDGPSQTSDNAIPAPLYTPDELMTLQAVTEMGEQECIDALIQAGGNWDLAEERLSSIKAALALIDMSTPGSDGEQDDDNLDSEEEQPDSIAGSDEEGTDPKPRKNNNKARCKPNPGLPSFDSDDSDDSDGSESEDDEVGNPPPGLPIRKRRVSSPIKPDAKRLRRESDEYDVDSWAE